MASDVREHLITVLIPTRERAAKLKFTLETVLGQEGDFRVLVSDNASTDGTHAVVNGFNDPRIDYVNTGRRMHICDSWDFALSHALGRYVVAVGDDDAVMPGALAKLEQWIATRPHPIYHWDAHSYCWPTERTPPTVDWLAARVPPSTLDLARMVRFSFGWGGFRYRKLPLVYHSLVERRILDQLRERTGRVFHSTQQDVCMAFMLPAFMDTAVHVGEAMTAYGQSEPAHGRKAMHDPNSVFAQRTQLFVSEYGDYRMHRTLCPEMPFWLNMIPDAMLVATDLFPEYYQEIPFDYSAMWGWLQWYWAYDPKAILAMRRKIRDYHPFDTARFLRCALYHQVIDQARHARNRVRRRRTPQRDTGAPTNMLDFAQAVAKQPQFTASLDETRRTVDQWRGAAGEQASR